MIEQTSNSCRNGAEGGGPQALSLLPLTALGRTFDAVQLRHTLPDGSFHIDLMLHAVAADRLRRLITFRLPAPLWEVRAGVPCAILRLRDHRAAYLTYEGEIAGDRGRVERIARGRIRIQRVEEERLHAQSHWEIEPAAAVSPPGSPAHATVFFTITRFADNRWRVSTGEVARFEEQCNQRRIGHG